MIYCLGYLLAKIESGKMNIESISIDLEELIQAIVDTFSVKINEKELNFKINIDDQLKTNIISDPVRISQI